MREFIDTVLNWHPLVPVVAWLSGLLLLALLAVFVTRRLLVRAVHSFTRLTSMRWDDALVEKRVFLKLANVVPAVIVYVGLRFVPFAEEQFRDLLRNVTMGYILLMLTIALVAALSAVNVVYEETRSSRARPIKGFVQLLQILVSLIGAVLVVAVLIERSPLLLLSGFGAMTAILIIVFRDTLLSLVASVQLSGQDLVRLDDWIEMPSLGADGEVIDMALHTIKVQNWDKTITSIPTHRLISDSFKNWRGMTESGGRRIKRAFHIDVSTVRFLRDKEIERFRNFVLLREYIERKQKELDEYNATVQVDGGERVNLRRLTNIGTLRAYLANYLAEHPRIHDSMTQMVRQLQPTPEGIPLEIYAFTRTTVWTEYEGIQADIFDHVFSIVGEFGLAIFQAPAGTDFRRVLAGESD